MNEHISQEPVAPNTRKRNLAITAGVVAGLVIVVGIALLLIFDPFGWISPKRGIEEAAAQAIPSDVAVYVSMDLGNITCEDLNPILWVLDDQLKQEGKCAIDELFNSLDESMERDYGLTFSDDVKPWLGESIAMGWADISLDFYAGFTEVELMFAIEVTDTTAATTFLVEMMDAISNETGTQFLKETYQDVVLYYVDAPDAASQITFCRSGNLLIFGLGRNSVRAAIDAQKGESLADSSAFQDTIAELPPDRLMTLFLNSEHIMTILMELFEAAGEVETFDLVGETFGPTHYEAAGVYIVDAGIRVDLAFVLEQEGLTDEMLAAYERAGKQPFTDGLMPEDALVYRVGSGLDRTVENFYENMTSVEGGEDITQSLMFFKMAFGFDPIDDFLAKLDGEWAFGIVPRSEGALAESLGVPLGFVFLAETSDPEGLLQVAEGISQLLQQMEIAMVEAKPLEKTMLYEVFDPYTGDMILTYGVGEGFFLLGSSADTLNELFEGGPSLADSGRYRQTWDEFPKDMAPVMFVDIHGFTRIIQENMPPIVPEPLTQEARGDLLPITIFALAGSPLEDRVSRATMILFIETD